MIWAPSCRRTHLDKDDVLRVLAGAAAHAVEAGRHVLAGGAVGLEKVDDHLNVRGEGALGAQRNHTGTRGGGHGLCSYG
jgi:hypothetical protein